MCAGAPRYVSLWIDTHSIHELTGSALQAGVTKSCTVRLNEEIYCIRDGGEWSDCPHGPGVNDLVLAIEKLYRSS